MKTYDIERDTPLLPHIIADSVIGELEKHLDQDLPERDSLERLLCIRAAGCYGANQHFRRLVRGAGNSGRDYLYCFMRHWLSGLLLEQGSGWRQRIPESFMNGLKIGVAA